nr:Plug domain-containing protein [Elizabethkingia bruuniana]
MKKRSIFLVAGVAMLYFNNAYGQETAKDSTKVSSIDQVVITGNSNPKKKIESSTAISTFNAKEIQKQNPISAAALLQRVPGFAVETSGGEVGNNLLQEEFLLPELMNSFRCRKMVYQFLKMGLCNLLMQIIFSE